MKLSEKITKKTVIAGSIILVVLIAVVSVLFVGKKEDSYRNIKVYEISGNAWVTREGKGQMDMYANMQLQSGDKAETGADTYVQLKLDEDKYVLLEPDTCIQIVAKGNAADSETKIKLEKGSIVNSIENKLSSKSSYEVETPSSTMAVRGTIFRITIEEDENGKLTTNIEVHDGKVECRITVKNQDGTTSEEIVVVEAGKQVTIQGALDGAENIGELEQLVYTQYDMEVLNFIGYSEGEDTEPATQETDELKENDSVSQPENEPDAEQEKKTELTKEEKQEGKKTTEDKKTQPQEIQETSEDEAEEEAEIEEKEIEETKKEEASTEQTPTEEVKENDNTVNEPSGDENNGNSENNGGSENNGAVDDENQGNNSAGDNNTGGSNGKQDSYTVTFQYGGKTFATQTVTSGNCVTEPMLKPTAAGTWTADSDTYDFSAPVNQDMELIWNAG